MSIPTWCRAKQRNPAGMQQCGHRPPLTCHGLGSDFCWPCVGRLVCSGVGVCPSGLHSGPPPLTWNLWVRSCFACMIVTQEESRRLPTMKTLDDTEEVVELEASWFRLKIEPVWRRCWVVVVSIRSRTLCFLSSCWTALFKETFYLLPASVWVLSWYCDFLPLSWDVHVGFLWCYGGLCCVLEEWSPSWGQH